MRRRIAVRFQIEGDVRFISHRDTVRLFERALARGEIPVRRSAGFNPRPQLSLPLPRNVGIASDDELLIIELATPLPADEIHARLSPQLPAGVRLTDVRELAEHEACVPTAASYGLPIEAEEAGRLAERIRQFLAADSVLIERTDAASGRKRGVDVRQFVREVEIVNDRLLWTQTVSQSGSARPGEVLAALGLDPRQRQHHLVRTRVSYDEPPAPNAVPHPQPQLK